MKMFLIALISIALSVTAQFALKAGISGAEVSDLLKQQLSSRAIATIIFDKFIVGGFFLYGLGGIVWLKVLANWDVSKAYPLVGLGFAVTAIVGLVIGENVTLFRGIGVAMICAGVFLVGTS